MFFFPRLLTLMPKLSGCDRVRATLLWSPSGRQTHLRGTPKAGSCIWEQRWLETVSSRAHSAGGKGQIASLAGEFRPTVPSVDSAASVV